LIKLTACPSIPQWLKGGIRPKQVHYSGIGPTSLWATITAYVCVVVNVSVNNIVSVSDVEMVMGNGVVVRVQSLVYDRSGEWCPVGGNGVSAFPSIARRLLVRKKATRKTGSHADSPKEEKIVDNNSLRWWEAGTLIHGKYSLPSLKLGLKDGGMPLC
jgi:hypothetical protein